MRYDVCSACMNFQPRMLTERESIPKHCNCPFLRDSFGREAGGFPSGVDVISCDFFDPYPLSYGDIQYKVKSCLGKGVSLVFTQPRNFKSIRIPKLYDNKQNIKTIEL